MKKLSFILILSAVIASCSLEIQKRHYRSGYHVSISKRFYKQKKNFSKPEEFSLSKTHSSEIAFANSSRSNSQESQKTNFPVSQPVDESLHYSSFIVNKNNSSKQKYSSKDNSTSKTNHQIKQLVQKTKYLSANEKKNSDFWFLGLAGSLASLFLFAFNPFVPATRKIGYWALNHRKLTRVLHFVGHVMLAGCALFLGKQLHQIGVITTDVTTYALAGVTSIVALLYPSRKHKKGLFKNTYRKQKLFALVMVMSGFSLFLNMGNRLSAHDWNYGIKDTDSNHIAQLFSSGAPNHESSKVNTAGRVVLTVVTCLVSMLLCLLIAAASCSLSCSGQEGLSVIILILGFPAVIISMIAVIKAIWRPAKGINRVPNGSTM